MSEEVSAQEKPQVPIVLISYAHESPDLKNWVLSLAQALRRAGIEVILDQWNLTPGRDMLVFMEQGITEADRVLMVCTPTYATKANKRVGGVGYEGIIISGELFARTDTNKFVCILRSGDSETSLPVFMKGRFCVDFRETAQYQASLEQLLRDLHKVPPPNRPPLGPNPYGSATTLDKGPAKPGQTLPEFAGQVAALLRAGDASGWHGLVRTVHQEFRRNLLAWYTKNRELDLAGPVRDTALTELMNIAVPAMTLGLCTVEAGKAFPGQRPIAIDTFLNIPEWPQAGDQRFIAVPTFLAYVHHHLVGALMLDLGQHDQAVRLLRTQVQDVDSGKLEDLWKELNLSAWPEYVSDCTHSWAFLQMLFTHESGWIGRFFGSEREFHVALGAYRLLASILEFASHVAAGTHPEDFKPRIPPMFLVQKSGKGGWPDLGPMLLKALPDGASTNAIASGFGVDRRKLDAVWKFWVDQWFVFMERRGYRILAAHAKSLCKPVERLP